MAQVIFLNRLLSVCTAEEVRRKNIQDHISSIHAMIQNESKGNKFNEALFLKRFHDEMRKSWVLLDGKMEQDLAHHLLSDTLFRL